MPFQRRTGIDLQSRGKKNTNNNNNTQNVYQKIKKEWVEEFFWKKYNKQTPIKEQKNIKEIIINQACKTEEVSDELKLYQSFNSQFMKNISSFSIFKNEFDQMSNRLQELPNNDINEEINDNKTKFSQCLNTFSHFLNDKNLEFKLKNYNETEILKKIMFFQCYLNERLMQNQEEDLAKINDLIFKMMCILFEKSH